MAEHHTTEDRFADELDAMSLGMIRPGDQDDLANFAAQLAALGGPGDGSESTDGTTLGASEKRRIWTALMAGQGVTPEQRSPTPVPGGAGSALALNPWRGSPMIERPRQRRHPRGVLRFLPAAQPSSTFVMVVLVLVLVGTTFAWIAPDGRFAPSVQATEPVATTEDRPVASPVASPGSGQRCEPMVRAEPESPVSAYAYAPAGPVDAQLLESAGTLLKTFGSCLGVSEDSVSEVVESIATDRFIEDTPGQPWGMSPDLDTRLPELRSNWMGAIDLGDTVATYPWDDGNDANSTLSVYTGSARTMVDGRIGVLAAITTPSLRAFPDRSWLAGSTSWDPPEVPTIWFFALSTGTDGMVLDEMVGLCSGQRCVDAFAPQASGATPAWSEDVITGECKAAWSEFSIDLVETRRYDRVGAAMPLLANEIDLLHGRSAGCTHRDTESALSVSRTDRYIETSGAQAERIISDLNAASRQHLTVQAELRRYDWLQAADGQAHVLTYSPGRQVCSAMAGWA